MRPASVAVSVACSRDLYLFILLASIALTANCYANTVPPIYEISGLGATFPYVIYRNWIFDYRFLKPNVVMSYLPVSSGAGRQAIKEGSVDWAASDMPLTDEEIRQYPEIVGNPILVAPVAVPYNLASVYGRLVLSRETLPLIFCGQITHWRDPRILADQTPEVASVIPNLNITVITRQDAGSGTTFVFSASMSSFSHAWNATYGTFAAWPANITSRHNFLSEKGPNAMLSAVVQIPGAVSYVPYSLLIGDASVSPALIKNLAGHVVELNSTSIQAAIADATYDHALRGAIHDRPGPNAYPMAGFTYFLVRNTNRDCEKQQEMLKFFNWVFTSELAPARAQWDGFEALRDDVLREVRKRLMDIQCPAGTISLRQIVREQHASPAYLVVFILSLVVFALAAGVIVAYLRIEWAKLPFAAVFFAVVLFIGTVIAMAANMTWYTVPTNQAVCELRKWLTALGITITLGGIFTRTFQIRQILAFTKQMESPVRTSDGNRADVAPAPRRVRHALLLGAGIVVVGLTQIALLTLWTGLTPMDAVLTEVNQIDLEYKWSCSGDKIWVWLGVEMGFILLLQLHGLFSVFRTWNMRFNALREPKWILIALYNVFLLLCIFTPLVITLRSDEDNIFWFAIIGNAFLCGGTALLVYIPKLIWRMKTPRATAQGTKSKGSTKMASISYGGSGLSGQDSFHHSMSYSLGSSKSDD